MEIFVLTRRHMFSLFQHFCLAHSGLVMPYSDINLGQHRLQKWLVAWWHQAITWTNVDLSSARFSDDHLRAVSDTSAVSHKTYCQTFDIRCTLVGNKIVDHSDVVGATPVGTVLTTPGFIRLGKDNCKTRRETFKFWNFVHLILEVWQ